MNHTQGPWDSSDPDKQTIRHNGKDIATVYCNNKQWEANACLIAAAPDLLLTLKSVLEYITHQEGSCPSGMRLMDATKAMRQAITQAEGVT